MKDLDIKGREMAGFLNRLYDYDFYTDEDGFGLETICINAVNAGVTKEEACHFYGQYDFILANGFVYLFGFFNKYLKNIKKVRKHYSEIGLETLILDFYLNAALLKDDEFIDKKDSDYLVSSFCLNLEKSMHSSKLKRYILKKINEFYKVSEQFRGERRLNLDYIGAYLLALRTDIVLKIACYKNQRALKLVEKNYNVLVKNIMKLFLEYTIPKPKENMYEDIVEFTKQFDTDFHYVNDMVYDQIYLFQTLMSETQSKSIKKKVSGEKAPSKKVEKSLDYSKVSQNIKEKLFGQGKQIDQILERMDFNQNKISIKDRIKGSFLLTGPSGTGKTELVKQISLETGRQIIRIDGGDLKESHYVAKLIGSPPGYVGYNESKTLFKKIKETPNAIILFDEVEKAHPDILDLFLHILDEGKAETVNSEIVSLKEATIFFTSNVGSKEVLKNKVGFVEGEDDKRKSYDSELKKKFKPEFLNRIDEIVYFNFLTKKDLTSLIDYNIELFQKGLMLKRKKNTKINLTKNAYEFILTNSNFTSYNAREIDRVLDKKVFYKILKILDNYDIENLMIKVDFEDEIKVSIDKSKQLTKQRG